MFRNEHNFSDNRPMGLNNPARLVEHYFPQSSFDVIQQVHFNLGLLNTLAKQMPTINAVGASIIELQGIQKYLGDIISVAQNLNNIVIVHNELPFVQELAPRLTEFKRILENIECEIEYFKSNHQEYLGELASKIKYIEDLYVQYECGLKNIICEHENRISEQANNYIAQLQCMVDEVAEWQSYVTSNVALLTQAVEDYKQLSPRLVHLEASDAVTLAMFTQEQSDIEKALKLIKESEKWGNKETINRARLKFEKVDMLSIVESNIDKTVKPIMKLEHSKQVEPENVKLEKPCNGGCHV